LYYPNRIRIYKISGSEILELMKNGLSLRNKNKRERYGDFLQISGFIVFTEDDQVLSTKKLTDMGRVIEMPETDTYTVATTEYVSDTAYRKFFPGPPVEERGLDIRKMVSNALVAREDLLKTEEVAPLLFSGWSKPRWIGRGFDRRES
jgi:hypothetical protein